MRENAAALQALVNELLAMLKGCVDEVFTAQQRSVLPPPGEGEAQPQQQKVEVPVIRDFEGLSLL
jgi:hypothetical protein